MYFFCAHRDDCGVFTMKFMEIFSPELQMSDFFSKDDIVHIRIQYANRLFFCERNTVDKSPVLGFKFELCLIYSTSSFLCTSFREFFLVSIVFF
jgi:hypothetical protein